MKKSKVAFGAMMLALIGFAAGSTSAQAKQWQQQCAECPQPGPSGECAQPMEPEPVCKQPQCPDGGCFPDIQAGECWSQCISPGQFKTVCNSVETGSSCPTPRVEPDGTIPKTVDKTVREKCYGLIRPVSCKDKRVGWTYEQVVAERTETITYITCQEQEVGPAYNPITKSMKVAYDEPVGRPGKLEKTRIKVKVKSEWDHLYRKKSSCVDCSDICRETEAPEYDWITGYTCRGKDQQCSFDYKNRYKKCPYEFEQCVRPELPSPHLACETREVTVVKPAKYEKKAVIVEVCSHIKPRKVPVPRSIEPVECSVPNFREECDAGSAKTQCVGELVQACAPFMEWRKEQFCNYDDKGAFIKRVQQALSQEGFDPGPLDGMMGSMTRQAVRDFQQANGLAQGGTLTQETVQALGIQQ